MTIGNQHRNHIRKADAQMPEALRNVLSQPETPIVQCETEQIVGYVSAYGAEFVCSPCVATGQFGMLCLSSWGQSSCGDWLPVYDWQVGTGRYMGGPEVAECRACGALLREVR